MTRSALPEHLNDPEEIENSFPDDKQFGEGFFGRIYTWFHKRTKVWTAFGPRATEWWACWREFPITICAFSGNGYLRWETTDGKKVSIGESQNVLWIMSAHNPDGDRVYLSAINYWCRWSIQLQWPLFFAIHLYFKDPPSFPNKPIDDRKMIYFRMGARRDADKVYWFPSLFFGLTFN